MTSIDLLINSMRDLATADAAFMAAYSLEKEDFTSAYDPKIQEDPDKALEREICFEVQIQNQDPQIGSYDCFVFVTVTNKDPAKSKNCGLALSRLLQNARLSNENLKVWYCWYSGGPVMAVHNNQRGAWDTTLRFSVRAA